MKRITLLAVSLLMAITAMAADIIGGTKLYLKAPHWMADNARFAAYFYVDNQTYAWAGCTLAANETNIYEVTTPDGTWANVIFCRMNPSTTENNWNNKWNQSANQTYDGINNLFTVKDGQWDNASGTWSQYVIGQPSVEFGVSAILVVNEAVTLSAAAANVADPVYVYSVKQGESEYTVLSGNTWTPAVAGEYTIKVEVKEGANGDVVASKEVATKVVNPIVAGTKLYLQPNAKWLEVAARYAAYFYVGTTNIWVDMEQVGGTNMYEVTVPTEGPWTNVIFCRMNPGQTENNWNNKWSQTNDLDYDGTHNLYKIDDNAIAMEEKSNGTWTSYEEEQEPTAIEETENALLFSINGRTLNVSMDNEAEISIYTISGQMIEHTVASNFTREMQQGVYVVRIGNQSQKLVIF